MRLRDRLKLEAYSALGFAGLRDRLRCPQCRSVGTWKPHGGIVTRLFDRDDTRRVPRWMCKWCGWYICDEDPDEQWAHVGTPDEGVWKQGPGPTPQSVCHYYFGRPINPWRG